MLIISKVHNFADMERIDNLFKKIEIKSLTDNLFKTTDEEWMLITAGDSIDFNTMTASWGTFGILWNKPIVICFIRPHRYTFNFVDKNELFTLSYFNSRYKNILSYCGTKSGRDVNKIKETGLIPIISENGGIAFEQARLIIECRKIYADHIKEDKFLQHDLIKKNYANKDFHKFFIGEISACYIK